MQKEIVIHADSNNSLVTVAKHVKILKMGMMKKLLDEIRQMVQLNIRTGIAIATRSMLFGHLMKRNDKLSSIVLNAALLSVLN